MTLTPPELPFSPGTPMARSSIPWPSKSARIRSCANTWSTHITGAISRVRNAATQRIFECRVMVMTEPLLIERVNSRRQVVPRAATAETEIGSQQADKRLGPRRRTQNDAVISITYGNECKSVQRTILLRADVTPEVTE